MEVVVESQGAIVETLAEGGVVRVGEEAAAEDEDGFGDAVAEAVADAEALGVAFGFPFFPDGFGGGGGGFAGTGGVEDAPEGGEVGVAVLVVAEDGFEIEFEEVRPREGIGIAEEAKGFAVGDDGPEGIGRGVEEFLGELVGGFFPGTGADDRESGIGIIKAEVVGTNAVRLTTNGPYPALLAQLVKLSIVPKALVESVGKDAFNLKPIGSGPYMFQTWQRGVQVTLVRNDKYWGAKGPFPTAIFRAVPDAATRVANLQAGASDLAVTLNSDLAAPLKNSPRAKVLSEPTERVAYLRLNPTKPPFDNEKVRMAVALAVDKAGLVDGILGGFDKPVGQMLTPAHAGWTPDLPPMPYDLKKAQVLVKEAGAAAKVEIELATSPVFDQRIVQAIQQMLVEAGLYAVNFAQPHADTAFRKFLAARQR